MSSSLIHVYSLELQAKIAQQLHATQFATRNKKFVKQENLCLCVKGFKLNHVVFNNFLRFSVYKKKTTLKTDSECRHFFVIHKQYKKSYTLMILKTRIK